LLIKSLINTVYNFLVLLLTFKNKTMILITISSLAVLTTVMLYFKLTKRSLTPVYSFAVILLVGFSASMCSAPSENAVDTSEEVVMDSTQHDQDHDHKDGECCSKDSTKCCKSKKKCCKTDSSSCTNDSTKCCKPKKMLSAQV
jgi:ABC-type nickel/cobalt efflux system permease component RcnA